MNSAELIKKIRKIEIRTRALTQQVFSGQYHSAFKGRGMAFNEVREYTYGDAFRKWFVKTITIPLLLVLGVRVLPA